MGAWELRHQASLSEWKERVAQCRSSGQTVTRWCQEHGIAKKTYYRWEREVVGRAVQQAGEAQSRFAELPAPRRKLEGSLVAAIQIGETHLEVYDGASPEVVAALCKVLNHAS